MMYNTVIEELTQQVMVYIVQIFIKNLNVNFLTFLPSTIKLFYCFNTHNYFDSA